MELARLKDATHPIALQASDAITANVDPLRLEQALTHLLDNAAKYSPAGAPIEVELQATSTALCITVTDHGIGIPTDHRANLFDRFYHAHSEGYQDGIGLGLFLSRRIVEEHGGALTVSFPENGGTCFLIQLPLT